MSVLNAGTPSLCETSVCNIRTCVCSQAAELAEFTAKISLLEEAKRKKEDEATEWQQKVHFQQLHQICPSDGNLCF